MKVTVFGSNNDWVILNLSDATTPWLKRILFFDVHSADAPFSACTKRDCFAEISMPVRLVATDSSTIVALGLPKDAMILLPLPVAVPNRISTYTSLPVVTIPSISKADCPSMLLYTLTV
ncbi:hypothetical protein [Eikenella glucosivorans]|uniref:hypothetical protein n=1 Tax=Eikenella glucosivorans TaxID=2766967 RepID=UPI001EE590D1|nr:hypothetical protein [Eikenella glucosivorans]